METNHSAVESHSVMDTPEEEKVPLYKRLHQLGWKTYLKISIVLGLIVIIILAAVFNSVTADIAFGFLRWMEDNPAGGAFLFIGVYFIATVLFIPGLILTVGAGFVFAQVVGQWGGVFLATFVVFIGAALGATAAMLIGRFVLREQVGAYAEKFEKFSLIDKVVELNGLKVTFLLRLAPIVPFNAFNYFMGLTSVALRDYCLAHFGMLPGTMAYCFLGSTLSAVSDASGAGFTSDPVVFIVFIVCLVVAFVGMFYVGYVAKKEFNKLAEQVRENEEAEKKDSEAEMAPAEDVETGGAEDEPDL